MNLSDAMMRGAGEEADPGWEQIVRLLVPEGREAGVRLRRAGVAPGVRREGRALVVAVPSVLEYEVVALDVRQQALEAKRRGHVPCGTARAF